LAGSCVVITSEMLEDGRDVDDPFGLVCTWRPDAVIFDDVDRAIDYRGDGWLLSGLTRVRAVVPLVIGTANTKDEFSGAALRPGRFDRTMRMDRMDDSIASEMLHAVPERVRKSAIELGLLGAYLDELAFRTATGDDPRAALEELVLRQVWAGDGYKHKGAEDAAGSVAGSEDATESAAC